MRVQHPVAAGGAETYIRGAAGPWWRYVPKCFTPPLTLSQDVRRSAQTHPPAHLQDLDHHLLIVGDVDCLEHFAVLPSAQLTNQLVVLLVAIGIDTETV